jgi:hypothetical protein
MYNITDKFSKDVTSVSSYINTFSNSISIANYTIPPYNNIATQDEPPCELPELFSNISKISEKEKTSIPLSKK